MPFTSWWESTYWLNGFNPGRRIQHADSRFFSNIGRDLAKMNHTQAGFPKSIGKYLVKELIARGGSSTVYLASSPEGQDVAIKQFNADAGAKGGKLLERESKALRRVKGNRVAKVIELVTDQAPPYLVMEYIKGKTLADAVSEGPFTGLMLHSVVEGLAESLEEMHSAGVIHRDLKPTNVILGPDGVRVVDLGISAISENVNTSTRLNASGTPGWLSPEQALGSSVNVASDIFNFGLLIAFAGSGKHPFGSGRADAMVYRIVNETPELESVPEDYRSLVFACLEKNPAQRPNLELIRKSLSGDQVDLIGAQAEPTVVASATRLWGMLGDPEFRGNHATGRGREVKGGTNVLPHSRRGRALIGSFAALALLSSGLLMWNPSSGPVGIEYSIQGANPLVGDAVVRVSSGSSVPERVVFNGGPARAEQTLSLNWSGGNPIRLEYLPSFSLDEPMGLSVSPSDIRLGIFTAGQPVVFQFDLQKETVRVSAIQPGLFWGLLPEQRKDLGTLSRGNEKVYMAEERSKFNDCVRDTKNNWANEIGGLLRLNDKYLSIRNESRWWKGGTFSHATARSYLREISDGLEAETYAAAELTPTNWQSRYAPYPDTVVDAAESVFFSAMNLVGGYDDYIRALRNERYGGTFDSLYQRESSQVTRLEQALSSSIGGLRTASDNGARSVCSQLHPDGVANQ